MSARLFAKYSVIDKTNFRQALAIVLLLVLGAAHSEPRIPPAEAQAQGKRADPKLPAATMPDQPVAAVHTEQPTLRPNNETWLVRPRTIGVGSQLTLI